MKKSAPTLIDEIYRTSFMKQTVRGWTSNTAMRAALQAARRFVLDEPMSVFLGELSTLAFLRTRPPDDELNTPRARRMIKVRNRTVEHLRMAARLPAETVWVEYNLRKCHARTQELLGRPMQDPLIVPEYEGWLLQRHPTLETAFIANVFAYDPDSTFERDPYVMWTFPVAFAWTADADTVLPWQVLPFSYSERDGSVAGSEVATGLLGYQTQRANIVFSDLVDAALFLSAPNGAQKIADLLQEWSGTLRRIWALFASINDLPVRLTPVVSSKGFMGRQQYRKFLDHKTITLTVPAKAYRKVARDALSLVHRRGGPVREHWRRDWRNPLSPLCEHEYGADERHMFCTRCHGRKIWIHEHVRGDTSRGFVTHDYAVTHEEPR